MTNPPFKLHPANFVVILLSIVLLTGATEILTDPTRPPENLIPPSKNLTVRGPLELTAVFIYPDHRFAYISGRKVSIGERVDEYTIINIQQDTVELKGSRGNSVVLSLLPKVKQLRQ